MEILTFIDDGTLEATQRLQSFFFGANNHIHTKRKRYEYILMTNSKIGEAHAAISEHRFMLNKLDGELSYFE